MRYYLIWFSIKMLIAHIRLSVYLWTFECGVLNNYRFWTSLFFFLFARISFFRRPWITFLSGGNDDIPAVLIQQRGLSKSDMNSNNKTSSKYKEGTQKTPTHFRKQEWIWSVNKRKINNPAGGHKKSNKTNETFSPGRESSFHYLEDWLF